MDIGVIIIIASLGMLLLVLFVILLVVVLQKRFLASKNQMIDMEKQHQKKLLDTTLEIAEHERQKIATNLHDDIGIIFNVLKLNLARLKKHIHNTETVDKIISESNTSIENSLDIVRAIYRDIVPTALKTAGLLKGLHELCKQLSHSSGIEIKYTCQETRIPLDKSVELQLYRLIKEVLNNTLKHGRPHRLEISIKQKTRLLYIQVKHNGLGITTGKIIELSHVSKGLGLKSILTRAELLNAKIDFKSAPKGDSLVEIEIPLVQ